MTRTTEWMEEIPGELAAAPDPHPKLPPQAAAQDAQNLCAYNQTRECFLGLHVELADAGSAQLVKRLSRNTLQSGEGLWLAPFRGIPAIGTSAPLDLIYMDELCRVIETVEAFPTFQTCSTVPRPASLLALPAHSIFSSQTQPGDQIAICAAEEMEQKLEMLSSGRNGAGLVQSAVVLREKPLWSDGPGVVEAQERPREEQSGAQKTMEMPLVEAGVKAVRPPRNWLKRWWSPDPRRAPREPAAGMAAYYWNGAPPKAHAIRDISASGMYLVTEDRWYPGTLVLMTLQKTECGEEVAERAISVHTRAVRWGADGVGLQFVVVDDKQAAEGLGTLSGADSRQMDRFLQRFKKEKSQETAQ